MWRRGEIDAHNCLFPLVMDCAAHRDYTLILVCVPVCFPGIDAHLENFTGPGLRDGSCWYLSTIHHVQYSTSITFTLSDMQEEGKGNLSKMQVRTKCTMYCRPTCLSVYCDGAKWPAGCVWRRSILLFFLVRRGITAARVPRSLYRAHPNARICGV